MTGMKTDPRHPSGPDVAAPSPADRDAAAEGAMVRTHIDAARRLRAESDHDGSVEIITTALRAGLWRHAPLWSELWSLMRKPEDYAQIRGLWLDAPPRCADLVPLLRTVARAASVAGEHDEARALLRRAIILRQRGRRGPRRALGRVKRSLVSRLPSRGSDAASFEGRAAVALSDLNRELEHLGVRSFLISGTLLGYLRESRFISWDKDIDVGFFTTEIAPGDLEAAFDRVSVFQVRRLDFNSDRLRVNHGNGTMIDVFPHYAEGSRIWHDGTATRWWNTPFELTTVTFLGKPQFVPDPPERYLEENYGNWRVPDPDFDARLDTPNVDVTDREFLDTLFYFSLLDAVTKNNRVKLRRYTELLRRLGEGEWLDRVSGQSGAVARSAPGPGDDREPPAVRRSTGE